MYVFFRVSRIMDGLFFLWPMIVPFILPILYTILYKRSNLKIVGILIVITLCIILFFYPLISVLSSIPYSYELVKVLLFLIFPICVLKIFTHEPFLDLLPQVGVQKKNSRLSITLALFFLPIMTITSLVVWVLLQPAFSASIVTGFLSFFESFTEEFFFRGILFLYLYKQTNLPIAYVTSTLSFILMHPQHFFTWFLLITIVQAILTIEVARRSENILGSWLIHGTNRLLWLTIFPLISIL